MMRSEARGEPWCVINATLSYRIVAEQRTLSNAAYEEADKRARAAMSDKVLIQQILNDVFPEECKALGLDTVKELVAGMSIVDPEKGSKFPLMEIAEVIKQSVEFLAASIAVYAALRRPSGPNKAKPSADQLEKAVERKGVKLGQAVEETAQGLAGGGRQAEEMNFIARLKRLGIRFELNARRYPLVVFQRCCRSSPRLYNLFRRASHWRLVRQSHVPSRAGDRHRPGHEVQGRPVPEAVRAVRIHAHPH